MAQAWCAETGKECFASQHDARKALADIRSGGRIKVRKGRQGPRNGVSHLNLFRCSCGAWHLGNTVRRK